MDYKFTPREADVIACLLQGLGNEAISRELGITVGVVKRHISSAARKMNISAYRYNVRCRIVYVLLRDSGKLKFLEPYNVFHN